MTHPLPQTPVHKESFSVRMLFSKTNPSGRFSDQKRVFWVLTVPSIANAASSVIINLSQISHIAAKVSYRRSFFYDNHLAPIDASFALCKPSVWLSSLLSSRWKVRQSTFTSSNGLPGVLINNILYHFNVFLCSGGSFPSWILFVSIKSCFMFFKFL